MQKFSEYESACEVRLLEPALRWNNPRLRLLTSAAWVVLLIAAILVISFFLPLSLLTPGQADRNLPMSFQHLFGTDWLGRDMFARTTLGLRLSLTLGVVTALSSTIVALALGSIAALGSAKVDQAISWMIDLFIGMPHLVFMVLFSFVVGGGFKGVIVGVGLTHWPTLARIIRAEILKVSSELYIQASRQAGLGSWQIFVKHIFPHVLPQAMVGLVLLFPHVILHEAGLSFLGFGLSPQTPAIGIILSEGLRHISSGHWWLVLFPTLLLVILAKSFDNVGERLRRHYTPATAHIG